MSDFIETEDNGECNYFYLWNDSESTLSEWGEILANAFGDHVNKSIEPIGNLADREGIDEDSLNLSQKQKLLAAEEYREEAGLPTSCPHEPLHDEDVCVFHTSREQRQERNISNESVCKELIKKINSSSGKEEDDTKCFAGGNFGKISITYRGLSSDSNKPILFQFANIDEIDLSHAVIDERMVFDRAKINKISCESTEFNGHLSFSNATINCNKINFDNSSFHDKISFASSNLETKKLSFQDCVFNKHVQMSNMDVEVIIERSDDVDTAISFNESRFEGRFIAEDIEYTIVNYTELTDIYAEYKNCRFSSECSFSYNKFNAAPETDDGNNVYDMIDPSEDNDSIECESNEGIWNVDFSKSIFEAGISTNEICIDGRFDISEVNILNGGINCTDAHITRNLDSSNTEISNGPMNFSRCDIGGELRSQNVVVSNGGSFFNHISVNGFANLSNSSFHGGELDLGNVDVFGSLIMSKTRCDTSGGEISFNNMHIDGIFDLEHSSLSGSQIDFSGSNLVLDDSYPGVEDIGAKFNEISFKGGRIKFSDVTIESKVSFKLSSFHGESTIFERISVKNSVDFSKSELGTRNTKLSDINTDDNPINFQQSEIESGNIIIKNYNTIYDFEEALIGKVKLDTDDFPDKEKNRPIFDHFVFKKTEFDGFNFNQPLVKKGIEDTDGRIHTTYRNKSDASGYLSKLIDWVKGEYSEQDYTPNELETTYMEAKLGAKENGDPNAVSEFFQKELHYRRHGYKNQFWNLNNELKNIRKRIWIARDYIANTTLWLSAGYGEKPSNIFATSIGIVLLFAVIFRGVQGLPPGTRFIDYITYSFQGFIQLVVGIQPSGGTLISFLTAFEGFIGAFLIALFVLTLTRSIER